MTKEEAIDWLKAISKDGSLFVNVLDAEKVKKVIVTDMDLFYKAFCEETKQKDDSEYINDIPLEALTEPSDLISRADAIDKLLSFKESRAKGVCGYDIGFVDGISHSINMIDLVPSVSAERVGEWIFNAYEHEHKSWYICSACGHSEYYMTPYCSECGARMENKK